MAGSSSGGFSLTPPGVKIPGHVTVEELEKAVQLEPTRVLPYLSLGAAYLSDDLKQAAEASLKRAVAMAPKSMMAHLSLANFYFSERRMREAEETIRAAVLADPEASLPRLALGQSFVETGRLEEAEKVFQELGERHPDDPLAYRALERFYWSTGQKEKAGAEFRSLLHAVVGNVDWQLVLFLLLGSVPGVILGSRLAPHAPARLLRTCFSAGAVWTGYSLI